MTCRQPAAPPAATHAPPPMLSAVVAVGSRDASRAAALLERWELASSASAYEGYEAVLADPRVQVVGRRATQQLLQGPAEAAQRWEPTNALPSAAVQAEAPSVCCPPNLPQAVYIALPSALHVPWVKAAAAAGKHILLEKPVAVNNQDLDDILRACQDAGVQLMDGTMWAGQRGMGRAAGGQCPDGWRAPPAGWQRLWSCRCMLHTWQHPCCRCPTLWLRHLSPPLPRMHIWVQVVAQPACPAHGRGAARPRGCGGADRRDRHLLLPR